MSVVECHREYRAKFWSTTPLTKTLYTVIAYRRLTQNIICLHGTTQKNFLKNNHAVRIIIYYCSRIIYYKHHTIRISF